MRSAIGLGLLGGAAAFSNDKVHVFSQKPLLADSCPLDTSLHNGKCIPAIWGSTTTTPDDNLMPISANNTTSTEYSHLAPLAHTLEESRAKASAQEDFPWTFWPECFANENTPEPYCIFSDQNFANGRGIAIITTAPLAYEMRSKAAFTHPSTALSRTNNHASPPFYQHDFPGKGRGLVANKTLHPGDQLFASTPILLSDPDLYQLSEPERLALLHRGVATLPPTSQTLFWHLMGHIPTADAIDDRVTTNNFEVTSVSDTTLNAVFPEIAMLNHDCRPNAAYFYDEESMTHFIHATRTITPGEELTITYTNNEALRADRIAALRSNWGFTCDCSACTAHPHLTSESDARMVQIATLQDLLNDYTSDKALGPTTAPAAAELMLSLYRQERLDANMGTAYQYAAEAYSSSGKKWEAVRYARLSVEMSMLDKGWADKDVNGMRKMVAAPELSWSWRKRVGGGEKGEGGCTCGGKGH
ncbi:SET domain-containing [Pyrenophora seminiperda CCB06]|uniref:SET domain-containing n=1 Tax=Pyrenophora seminiperda CCB06 TaxID=1302712 RepID=A0A3M7M1C5_9PLEO|nr:SET domain-containing [Pyrenophora seminiperda CCB06]